MTSFAHRQYIKAAQAIGATLLLGLWIWLTIDVVQPAFAQQHPLLYSLLLMFEISLLPVCGSQIVYHLQAGGAASPGRSIAEQQFRDSLRSSQPFVLYLRNFKSEQGASATPRINSDDVRPRLMWVPNVASMFESHLHDLLGKRFRLVLIENTRADTIPYFHSVVCRNETWRQTVQVALAHARLVILAVEEATPGLMEEIELVSELASDGAWVIYSASATHVSALSALLAHVAWQTRLPAGTPLRHMNGFALPTGVEAHLT